MLAASAGIVALLVLVWGDIRFLFRRATQILHDAYAHTYRTIPSHSIIR